MADPQPAASPRQDAPEAVRAAWDKVVEAWDEPGRHTALLALVAQSGSFAWAAARYRERGDDPVAKAQLERIGRAATAAMFASATKRPDAKQPYRSSVLVLVVLLIMLVIGMGAFYVIHRNHESIDPPSAPR